MNLRLRLGELLQRGELLLPLPGEGQTANRHRRLLELGREDLSLARLAEAHVDALAILAEAGRSPDPAALYGVWASEAKNHSLRLESGSNGHRLYGSKAFCSGAGLLDRALITVVAPEHRLIDVDLRANASLMMVDGSSWIAAAFAGTGTATVEFNGVPVTQGDIIQGPRWYLERPGFGMGLVGRPPAGRAAQLVWWTMHSPNA